MNISCTYGIYHLPNTGVDHWCISVHPSIKGGKNFTHEIKIIRHLCRRRWRRRQKLVPWQNLNSGLWIFKILSFCMLPNKVGILQNFLTSFWMRSQICLSPLVDDYQSTLDLTNWKKKPIYIYIYIYIYIWEIIIYLINFEIIILKIKYSWRFNKVTFLRKKLILCKKSMFENFNISENSTYIISVEVVAKVL